MFEVTPLRAAHNRMQAIVPQEAPASTMLVWPSRDGKLGVPIGVPPVRLVEAGAPAVGDKDHHVRWEVRPRDHAEGAVLQPLCGHAQAVGVRAPPDEDADRLLGGGRGSDRQAGAADLLQIILKLQRGQGDHPGRLLGDDDPGVRLALLDEGRGGDGARNGHGHGRRDRQKRMRPPSARACLRCHCSIPLFRKSSSDILLPPMVSPSRLPSSGNWTRVCASASGRISGGSKADW
jgi:hypothetical protein